MRGKHYDPQKRKVFSNGGYVGIIIAVIVVAIALTMTLLVYLPSTEELTLGAPKIVGISYDANAIGVGSDLSRVYVTVTYSDGSTENVAISNMVSEGLDVTTSGEQNVSLSFGGFEQTISVVVKDINCNLTYTASTGGRIQGESSQSIVSGNDADSVIAIPETGYEFVEWSDGYPYALRKDLAVNESKGYIAIFKKSEFRVIFFYNDGTVASEEDVLYGEKATKAPVSSDPKMNVYGYTFVGWSVAEEDYASVKRDMSIYPQYVKTATDVTVNVSIDNNGSLMGETDAREEGYYAHGVLAAITATPYPSREFNSWFIRNSDGVYEELAKDEERIIVIGDNRVNVTFKSSTSGNSASEYILSFTPSEEIAAIDVTAGFVYSSSGVTFINYQNAKANNQEYFIDGITYGTTLGEYLDEYVNGVDNTVTIDETTGIIRPADVVGMTFIGWYVQGDDTQTIITKNMIFGQPTTLVAKWGKQVYTIKFTYLDEHNVTQLYHTIEVVYQNTIGSGGGVPMNVPSKEKYLFVGWMDALTGDMIDDRTQISLKAEYLQSEAFVSDNEINVVAKWAPVEHTLLVNTLGAGTVYVTKSVPGGESITEAVFGTYTIYETYDYTVSFSADEGNAVSEARWDYSDVSEIYKSSEGVNMNMLTVTLQNGFDNVLSVVFIPQTFNVKINNGTATYSGYVTDTTSGITYDSSLVEFEIDYGNTLTFNIHSYNEAFSIQKILVTGRMNGKSYFNELIADLTDSEMLEYALILENCVSDVVVDVVYSGRSYYVTVNKPDSSEGNIFTTDFNGPESGYTIPELQQEFTYGEIQHYVVTATEGKYISSVRIDGIKQDVYKNAGTSLIFYDWEINGVYYGVGLKYLDDEYLYCYGTATVNEKEYMYCESLLGDVVYIYEVVDAGNEDYRKISSSDTSVAYGEIYAGLTEKLNVNEKKLSNVTTGKDLRVTKVKVMYVATKNITLSATYENITYTISIEDDERGAYSISKVVAMGGESSSITVTPITGYYVAGYSVNGGETILVSTIDRGATCNIKINDIRSDVNVMVVYETLTYNVVFSNANANVATVTVNDGTGENELSASYAYEVEYASGKKYVLTIQEGYYLTSVKINGVAQPLVRLARTYSYVNNNVVEDVIIEVTCAIISTQENVNGFRVDISSDNVTDVVAGVDYGATASDDNVITLIADDGYALSVVYLKGNSGGSWRELVFTVQGDAVTVSDTFGLLDSSIISAVSNANSYNEAFNVTLSADVFDDVAVLYAVGNPSAYALNVTSVGSGNVDAVETIYYGDTVTININALANYYISAFKINGKDVSFRNSNWTNLTYASAVNQYVGGTYSFVACQEVDVYVEFSIYSYVVTLDPTSTNGTTILSVEGSSEELTTINHGEYLNISMSADAGYHISDVLINGASVGYSSYSDVANDNTTDTFSLRSISEPATRNVTVKVVYSINRYALNYEIENASLNFSGMEGAGTFVVPEYSQVNAGSYTGIAHGDNFYFEVYPSVGAGYYLHSVTIKYKGYGKSETIVTRYCDDEDGIVKREGGTIWFNRFMFGNNTDSATGVTADIELIKVTFKSNSYNISFSQQGDQDGGKMAFSVSNANASGADVVVFDENGDLYYIRPSDGVIYEKDGEIFVATDIKFTNRSGKWTFYSEGNDTEYNFNFEYGLRYVVSVKPTVGYERKVFTVNGEDKLSSVNNDKYSTNVYRDTDISVTYEILTFNVVLSSTVYNSSMNKLPATRISEYMNVTIYDFDTNEVLLTTDGKIVDTISGVFDYGTKIKVVITPNFAQYGIYLYSFVVNNLQQGNLGDTTGVVTYAQDGQTLTSDIAFKAIFRVKSYSVGVTTTYNEDIKNETLNTVANDATGAYNWSVYWNESTVIKVIAGEGYYVDRVVIEYTENGEDKTITVNNYNLIEGDYGTVESGLVISKDNDSAIYGLRDIITLYGVTSAYKVKVYFARNAYQAMYVLNDPTVVYNVNTQLNVYNSSYPSSTHDSLTSANPWTVNVKSYDELTVDIEPKDGYNILETEVTLESVVYNETTDEYEIMYDDNGNALVRTFKLYETGTEEGRMFTFHEATKVSADYYISSDVRVYINVEIKEYTLSTSITRTDAALAKDGEKNVTAVTLAVKDLNNNNLDVSGQIQRPIEYGPNDTPGVLVAEHHGTINYLFSVPYGYMLESFVVNGFTKDELVEKGILVANEERRTSAGAGTSYGYDYTLTVSTALINGSDTNPWIGNSDINVSISIIPINYVIHVWINGEEYDFDVYNDRNGVSDGKEIIVYAGSVVTHFGSITIEPMLYEGYKISSTHIYLGVEESYNTKDKSRFEIPEESGITARTTYKFTSPNMIDTDVLTGLTHVHVVYRTEILTYDQVVSATVFYNHNSVAQNVPFGQKQEAGQVEIFANGEKQTLSDIDEDDTVKKVTNYTLKEQEYFTQIRIEAKANEEKYALYGIYEIYTDIDGNSVEEKVVSGQRGVILSVIDGITVLTYTVNSFGVRNFKFEFKERVEVTLYVENPYKYVGGSNAGYKSYTSIVAYEEGNVVNSVIHDTSLKTVDQYVYYMYVGNRIWFEYKDAYRITDMNQLGVRYYNTDLSTVIDNINTSNTIDKINSEVEKDLSRYECKEIQSEDAGGYKINSNTTFYLVTNVYGYSKVSISTVGASDSVDGGEVLYNGVVSESGANNSSAMRAGKVISLELKPKANYAFYQLKARRVNYESSAKNGVINFYESEVEKWQIITFKNYEDVDNFNGGNSNGYTLLDCTYNENTMSYSFIIFVMGDMEFEAEFYRTYNVDIGIYRTDVVSVAKASGSNDGITHNGISIRNIDDEVFGEDSFTYEKPDPFDPSVYHPLMARNGIISYGATFEVKVTKPEGNYQFVGWYVNDVNAFEYLESLLPSDNYLVQSMYVNVEDMPALINNDKKEVEDIKIYAVFQPILDVTVLNQKYYAFSDHFNSWEMGDVVVEYYPYEDDHGIYGVPNKVRVAYDDEKQSTIAAVKTRLEASQAFIQGGDRWSVLHNDSVINGYSSDMLDNCKLYSSIFDFTILSQNVTDNNFIDNTWRSMKLGLEMSGMPQDVIFSSWQYYKWSEDEEKGEWVDIKYWYEDKSAGQTPSGLYPITDCYSEYYDLDLISLYNGYMPNAVSSSDPNNIDVNRPLLIRADVYKQVKVKIGQYAYETDLNGEISRTELKANATPAIHSYEETDMTYNNRSVNEITIGEFEYGTRITITNDDDAPEKGVFLGDTRYRFLGWYSEIGDGTYYFEDSENSDKYDIQLTCVSDESTTEFLLMAYYVAQYRQTIYSYNVGYGVDEPNGNGEGAPEITIRANAGEELTVYSISKLSTSDKIDYTSKSTVIKYYWINSVTTVGGQRYPKVSADESFSKTDHVFEYYIDAGLEYTLSVDTQGKGTRKASYEQAKSGSSKDFNTYFDTLYEFVHGDETIVDYKSYYNTGEGTYYIKDENKFVDSATLTTMATEKIGTINNTGDLSAQSNYYYVKYITTAVMVFYNFTYGGGISVDGNLASDISGGKSTIFTVWDTDPKYGDWYAIEDNKQVGYGANGEVVIRVSLIDTISGGGYGKEYKFAYPGMASGNGIKSPRAFTHSGVKSLFELNVSQYRRWEEFDMTKFESAELKVMLFGDESYTSSVGVNTMHIGTTRTANKYCSANTGTPTPDEEGGFRITNAEQFKNIDRFWTDNGNTCEGVVYPDKYDIGDLSLSFGKVKFVLAKDIMMIPANKCKTGIADEVPMTADYEPICSHRSLGFDGILDGKGKYIGGVSSENVSITDYGLFSRIVGGEVYNLMLDNSCILSKATNIGILAGYAQDATIQGITLKQCTDYMYTKSDMFSTLSGGNKGRRISINSGGTHVGSFIGEAKDCVIDSVTLIVGSGHTVEIARYATAAGSVFGKVSGGTISNITVDATGGWVLVGHRQDGKTAGGVFGIIEGGAVVSNVIVKGNYVIGHNANTVINVGGVAGLVTGDETILQYVNLDVNRTNENFKVDVETARFNTDAGAAGMYLFASNDSESTTSTPSNQTTGGKIGGIVGALLDNATLNNYNPKSSDKYVNVVGAIRANGGTIGGIVGANTGMVTGFDLKTGKNNSERFIVYAWLAGNFQASANVGGVVGANGGVVDDCGVTGNDVNANSQTKTEWKSGHLYVFKRSSYSDDDYLNIQTGLTGEIGYKNKYNVVMGGIVGLNVGSIFNSFVKNTRMTNNVQFNADSGGAGSCSIIGNTYATGIEAGLIAGYMVTSAAPSNGYNEFEKYINGANYKSTSGVSELENNLRELDLKSARIQSCYSSNSTINVSGRVYMDAYDIRSSEQKSHPSLVLFGGILGGVSNTGVTDLITINHCYSESPTFIHQVISHGANTSGDSNTDKGIGFSRKKGGNWFTGYVYEQWMNRPSYLVEMRFGYIVASTKNSSKTSGQLDVNMYKFNGNTQLVIHQSVAKDTHETSDGNFLTIGDDGFPGTRTTRFVENVTVSGSTSTLSYISGDFVASAFDKENSKGAIIDDEETNAGFMAGRLIRTNPYTGKLYGAFTKVDKNSYDTKYTFVKVGKKTLSDSGEIITEYLIKDYQTKYADYFLAEVFDDKDGIIYAVFDGGKEAGETIFNALVNKDSTMYVR